jgi:hypothetical protein
MAQLPEIKVTIEQSIHAALREVVQSIYDHHSIRVDSLRVEWIGTQQCGDPMSQLVGTIVLQTTSY